MLESSISQRELDKRLEEGVKVGFIPGDQWFRKAKNWFSITSFANPFKTVYSELVLLMSAREEFENLMRGRPLVFYGVGTGDTEALIVQWLLEKGEVPEVYGIDVNWEFLEVFSQTLKNLSVEYEQDVFFKGYHTLFQKTNKRHFKENGNTHICLGNTIGNFEQDEIFSIFKSNTEIGELLVLGVHLGKEPAKLLRQYSDNKQIAKLICESIGQKSSELSFFKELRWGYNEKTGAIEAWVGDVQVFHSKKYSVDELVQLAGGYGFEKVSVFEKGDCAILMFKRI